jgi:hypothetical protein
MTDSAPTLSAIDAAIASGDDEQVLSLTTAYLTRHGASNTDVLSAYFVAHAKAAPLTAYAAFVDAASLKQDSMSRALSVWANVARAYALYRQDKLEDGFRVLETVEKSSAEDADVVAAVSMLEAQMLYRKGDSASASQMLQRLEHVDSLIKQDSPEFMANKMAALGLSDKVAENGPSRAASSYEAYTMAGGVNNLEILFNLAYSHIRLNQLSEADQMLSLAAERAKTDLAAEEVAAECLPIQVQRAFIAQQMGYNRDAKTLLAEAVETARKEKLVGRQADAVAKMNAIAMDNGASHSLKRITALTKEADRKRLSPEQAALLRTNRLRLLLKEGKFDLLEKEITSTDEPLLRAACAFYRGKAEEAQRIVRDQNVQPTDVESLGLLLAIQQSLSGSSAVLKLIQQVEGSKHANAQLGPEVLLHPDILAMRVDSLLTLPLSDSLDALVRLLGSAIDFAKSTSLSDLVAAGSLAAHVADVLFTKHRDTLFAKNILARIDLSFLHPRDAATLALVLSADDAPAGVALLRQVKAKVPVDEASLDKLIALLSSEDDGKAKKTSQPVETFSETSAAAATSQGGETVKAKRHKKRHRKPKRVGGVVDPERWKPLKERSYYKIGKKKRFAGHQHHAASAPAADVTLSTDGPILKKKTADKKKKKGKW